MFAGAASVFVLALPLLATAIALPGSSPAGQCSGGALQCCDSVQSPTSSGISSLLGILGVVGTVTGSVGVTCSPITLIGLSGTSCTQQSVCCTNNSFSGVIALGCTPININL